MRQVAGGLFLDGVCLSRAALAAVALLGIGAHARPARAQTGGDEDLPVIRLSGAGIELLRVGVPRAEGDATSAVTAAETLSKDLDVTGLFQVLDPASFPAALQGEGLGFSSPMWTQVGAQAVVKMRVAGGQIEGRLYVTARGDTAQLSKVYRGADVRDAVHDFANDIVKSFTGQPGVFGSRIAIAMSGKGAHEKIGRAHV